MCNINNLTMLVIVIIAVTLNIVTGNFLLQAVYVGTLYIGQNDHVLLNFFIISYPLKVKFYHAYNILYQEIPIVPVCVVMWIIFQYFPNQANFLIVTLDFCDMYSD